MSTSFIIFIRALGLYALFTLPVIFSPVIYIISMLYVLSFGWFACALFMFIAVITVNTTSSFIRRMAVLSLAVPVSVAFAFQMIEVFGAERNVWHSGGFLLFPVAATISGWVSLMISATRMAASDPDKWERG
ncbi:MAG: hypothetical protein NTW29_16490 [Bacteroidetes bacterium]|nr:hypothetical protein [Bacteroidota bacterium]